MSNTKSTELDPNFEAKDNEGAGAYHIVSWISGVSIGIFLGIFCTVAFFNLVDPPCAAEHQNGYCSEHSKIKVSEHNPKK